LNYPFLTSYPFFFIISITASTASSILKFDVSKTIESIKNTFDSLLDIATLRLEIKTLREQINDFNKLERKYIDKISKLKSDNRVYKIQNTKLINKNIKLNEEAQELKNRVSQRRNLFNLFVVFLATGIWHGASWNFVFWGLWHGIFIIFEKITGWHKRSGGLKINIAQHLYTIFAFVIGWVMFRADNMAYACEYIKNMFGLIAEHQITYKLPYYIDNIEIIAFTAAVFCAMPLFKGMLDIKYKHKVLRTLVNVWLILLFVLSSAEIAASTYNPFIYFRF